MTGQMTQAGFAPDEPTVSAILERVGMAGWSGFQKTPAIQEVEDNRAKATDDIKRCYAQLFATPAGERVLNDIVEQTLRRAPAHPGGAKTMEEQTAYVIERMGQNGIAAYILRMIHDGRQLPPPGSKKPKKKSA